MAQTAVPPALAVQQIAPQLVAFAGSQGNFESLVNGLAQGTPVQLVSALPNGFNQVVSFTPAGARAPAEIAQILETARQQLIGLGIGSPTAEQVGFTLMGGVVPTALGGTQVPGALNTANPPSPAAQTQLQTSAAAGSTFPRTNTSDSPTAPGTTSRSPLPPVSATAAPGASAVTGVPAVTSSVNVQFSPGAPPATTSGTTAATAPRGNPGAAANAPRLAPGTAATPVTRAR